MLPVDGGAQPPWHRPGREPGGQGMAGQGRAGHSIARG